MANPRIIIADTDVSYIYPLQQKFVEEYYQKIDLEIIDNKGYFENQFSTPQNVDILIVSEELYSPLLHRHNIKHIFMMLEQPESNQLQKQNIHTIYKYTNLREIFNRITTQCVELFSSRNTFAKHTQIVLVYSGCGGVGKTTLALGLCACINSNLKKVLYLNASHLQSFQSMLSDLTPISSSELYAKLSSDNIDAYSLLKRTIRNEGFYYIPSFRAALMSLNINYSIYRNITIGAKNSGEYDYIVIDADTVFDEEKTRLIDIADKVIVVTKQNKASILATNNLITNINKSTSDKFVFICNDYDEDNSNDIDSTDLFAKYSISEYVKHISHFDKIKANDLASENAMQRVAFLVV